jgi:hypothetical protein
LFSGAETEIAAAQRQAISRLASRTVAGALTTLLAKPEDPAANQVLGDHLLWREHDLDLALPCLASGSDAKLTAVAGQELAKPATPAERLIVADGWYDLSKGRKEHDRDLALDRARWWYRQAVAALSGLGKDRAATRIAEIDRLLPPPPADWNNLDDAAWTTLKGQVIQVQASDSARGSITLPAGTQVRIVPQPSATWQVMVNGQATVCSWRGVASPRVPGVPRVRNFGAMVITLADQPVQANAIVSGPGRIAFMTRATAAPRVAIRLVGTIPVKIVPVDAAK